MKLKKLAENQRIGFSLFYRSRIKQKNNLKAIDIQATLLSNPRQEQ